MGRVVTPEEKTMKVVLCIFVFQKKGICLALSWMHIKLYKGKNIYPQAFVCPFWPVCLNDRFFQFYGDCFRTLSKYHTILAHISIKKSTLVDLWLLELQPGSCSRTLTNPSSLHLCHLRTDFISTDALGLWVSDLPPVLPLVVCRPERRSIKFGLFHKVVALFFVFVKCGQAVDNLLWIHFQLIGHDWRRTVCWLKTDWLKTS